MPLRVESNIYPIMTEKLPENNVSTRKPEVFGLFAGIAGIIKKVRTSIANTLSGGRNLIKSGIKKIRGLIGKHLGYSMPAIMAAAAEILPAIKSGESSAEKPKESSTENSTRKPKETTNKSSAEKPHGPSAEKSQGRPEEIAA